MKLSFAILFLVLLGNSPYLYAAQNEKQKIVDEAIDKINIQIAKYFINSRLRPKDFPYYIQTYEQLMDFLNRYYLKGHPLITLVNQINSTKHDYLNTRMSLGKFIEKRISVHLTQRKIIGKYYPSPHWACFTNAFESCRKCWYFDWWGGSWDMKCWKDWWQKKQWQQFQNDIEKIITEANAKMATINEKNRFANSDKSATNFNFIVLIILVSIVLIAIIFTTKKHKHRILLKINRGQEILSPKPNHSQPGNAEAVTNKTVFSKYNKSTTHQTNPEKITAPITNPVKKTKKTLPLNDRKSPTTEPATKTQTVSSNPWLIKKWFVIGGSVIGKSHIESQLPCQDNHYYEDIGNDWGVAVVADGAGSAQYSHLGSQLIVQKTAGAFHELVIKNNWHQQNQLPSNEDWHLSAKKVLTNVKEMLESYANVHQLETKSLAGTVIAVIYSPIGLLITHIGDGRAAYCNDQNEWKSIMIPWKGEEANATVFMTSDIWHEELDHFVESRVITEKPIAFTLMSDGCEKASFECSQVDPSTKQWSDPNKPYPKFFKPLVNTLKNLKQEGTSYSEIKNKWHSFLSDGNQTLKDESDDKTMILGVLI
jgi:hypothetical protein